MYIFAGDIVHGDASQQMEAMRERMKEVIMDRHTFVEMHLGHQLAQVYVHAYIHI
jgi:hypothetical protein